jgi:hypothetical protein
LFFILPFLNVKIKKYLLNISIKYNNIDYFKKILKSQHREYEFYYQQEYRITLDKAAFYNNTELFTFLVNNVDKYCNKKSFKISVMYHKSLIYIYILKNNNKELSKLYLDSKYFTIDDTASNFILSRELIKTEISLVTYILNQQKLKNLLFSDIVMLFLLKNKKEEIFRKHFHKNLINLKEASEKIRITLFLIILKE